LPTGAAVDLGCGGGVAAVTVARTRGPVVGLDIAPGAVSQARARARGEGAAVAFVVGEVPLFPFRSQAFALVFDRGCLQNIRPRGWGTYFAEIARLLRPRGVLQLYVSRADTASGLSGLVRRVARAVTRKGGASSARPDAVRRLLSAGLEVEEMREFPFSGTGSHRTFLYALIRKRAAPGDEPAVLRAEHPTP
jgi:ubiquinone/menaquinone biosynthesis C-methylase UbiE